MKNVILAIVLLTLTSSLLAQEIKLSFKIVLSNANGTRPIDGVTNAIISDEMIAERVEFTNQLMGTYKRGFRFTYEIEEVGGQGTTLSANWYNTNSTSTNRSNMEDAAEADPTTFKWKTDMVNIYLNNGSGGGCSFPGNTATNSLLTLLGSNVAGFFTTYMHEIGHFFDLPHTHSSGNPSDVLIDVNSDTYDQDSIAQDNYGLDYNQLSSLLQDSVDYTFFNIMSYHTDANLRTQRYYLTEGQLDQFYGSIYEYVSRDACTFHDPIYVDKSQTTPASCSLNSGAPDSEYKELYTCALGKTNAGRDVLVIRPGTYSGAPNVINNPCVMTATRAGDVLIKP